MKADNYLWLFIALLLAFIAVVALGTEPPAKPIGYLFIALALLVIAGLIVRWRRRRKAEKKEEEDEDDDE